MLSLALNAAGLSWGLPARWHPDEKADVTAKMAEGQGLAPDSFVNPSLPLYLMLGPVWLQDKAARAGVLRGHAADPLAAGRMLSALAGAAAVLVLGWAAWRSHPLVGARPAFLLALMPGFVNLCHFATPEPWLLLGSAATLALAVAHAEGRAPAVLPGLALGLTASTKYTAAALIAPVLAAVWLRDDADGGHRARPGWVVALGAIALATGLFLVLGGDASLGARLHLDDARLLHADRAVRFLHRTGLGALLAGLAALAVGVIALAGRPWARRLARGEVAVVAAAALFGFTAGSPFVLVQPLRFLSALAFNDQTRFEYKGLTGHGTSFGPYLRLLAEGLTGPLLVAAGLGLLVALGRALRRERAAVVALAAVAPYLLVAASAHQALRFLAPVFPAAAWLAALGLVALPRPPLRQAATVLVLARAALAALLVVRLFYVDSRRQATRWIEENVPAGATLDLIANVPGYAPTVPPGRTLRVVPTLSREMAPAERFAEAAARYPAEASEWLVLTASYYERFLDHPDQQPEKAAFFRALLDGHGGFAPVARFRQEGWRRPPAEFLDPEIVILRKAVR